MADDDDEDDTQVAYRSSLPELKNDWFKAPNSNYDSVLYVPATKISVLGKHLQHQEDLNIQRREKKIKNVEMPGSTVRMHGKAQTTK